jgi:2-deoxy-D-gluconate 3-dehydrogenase
MRAEPLAVEPIGASVRELEETRMSWGPFDLTGRSALVTGAAMGIGFGIASRFREAGADVVIADIDAVAADAAIERLRHVEGVGRLTAVRTDVSDPASAKAAVGAATAHFGRVDILVNNAGIYPVAALADLTPELINRILAVNVAGVLLMTQAAAGAMATSGGGVVVNIASMDALHPSFPGLSTYGASKGAVVAMTKHHALELGMHNIRVNAIAPGGIWTEGAAASSASGGLAEEDRAAIEVAMVAKTSVGRMGTPDDIAKVAVFLASSAADYMTGETVLVDGGVLVH